jgi:hypothetical protein
MGVVVMGPVGGGRLGAQNDVFAKMIPGIERIPELAMRFVLCNPGVDIALSGMSTLEQVLENVKICSDDMTLSADEQKILDAQLERLRKAADLYCTGCRYCMPCPSAVDIPRVFSIYNQARIYGMADSARKNYARWTKNQPNVDTRIASACIECGKCEKQCPQHIQIMKQLKDAHSFLSN